MSWSRFTHNIKEMMTGWITLGYDDDEPSRSKTSVACEPLVSSEDVVLQVGADRPVEFHLVRVCVLRCDRAWRPAARGPRCSAGFFLLCGRWFMERQRTCHSSFWPLRSFHQPIKELFSWSITLSSVSWGNESNFLVKNLYIFCSNMIKIGV